MYKLKDRILSLILCAVLTLSTIPGNYLTAWGKLEGEGGTAGTGGAESSGAWSYTKQGYRVYITNIDGKRVSNIVDFVYDWNNLPNSLTVENWYFINTKLEKPSVVRVMDDPDNNISARDNARRCITILELETFEKDGTKHTKIKDQEFINEWPTPLYSVNGVATARGDQAKQWLLKGAKSLKSNSNLFFNMNHYAPVGGRNSSSGSTSGGNGNTTGDKNTQTNEPAKCGGCGNCADCAVDLIYLGATIRKSVWDKYNTYKNAKYEKSLAIKYACQHGLTWISMANEFSYVKNNPNSAAYLQQVLTDTTDELDKELEYKFVIGNPDNYYYVYFSSTLEEALEKYKPLMYKSMKIKATDAWKYLYADKDANLQSKYSRSYTLEYACSRAIAHGNNTDWKNIVQDKYIEDLLLNYSLLISTELNIEIPKTGWSSLNQRSDASNIINANNMGMLIAYADDPLNYTEGMDNSSNENSNLITLLGMKYNGDKLFKLYKAVYDRDGYLIETAENRLKAGFEIDENGELKKIDGLTGDYMYPAYSDDGKFKTNSDGTLMLSNLETCCANDYRVIVEPLYFVRPASSHDSDGDGKWEATNLAPFIFYGTPTNYGQAVKMSEAFWTAPTYGGHYHVCFNGIGKTSLYLNNKPFTDSSDNILCSIPTEITSKVTNPTLADQSIGYAMHYYVCEADDPGDKTHTFDGSNPSGPSSNPEHPAPPPNPDPPSDGSDVNIVKVYQHIKLDGTVEHMATKVRNHTASIIEIEHEDKYKAVSYITSPEYVGDTITDMENADWEDINTVLELNNNITDSVNNPVANSSTPEPDYTAVIDAYNDAENTKAGDEAWETRLGVYCNCTEKCNCGAIESEHGKHFHDDNLYVLLIKMEEKPYTSTWDDPDPDPQPAPDPVTTPEDPSNPVDPNNPQLRYTIVKVYEEEDTNTGVISHIETFITENTLPSILIEDEIDYSVIEWKWGYPNSVIPVTSSSQWEDLEIKDLDRTFGSGTNLRKVDITDTALDRETTLYVRLRKSIGTLTAGLEEDLTESQITKVVMSGDAYFNNGNGYVFTAKLESETASNLQHVFKKHRGTHTHGSGSNQYSCSSCCESSWVYDRTCTHLTRANDADGVWADFTVLSTSSYETIIAKPTASTDFKGTMYGKGSLSDTIRYGEYNLHDGEYTTTDWAIHNDGSQSNGIEYVTTISRQALGDNPTVALYKKNSMDADTYSRITSILSADTKPVGTRVSTRESVKVLEFSIGHAATHNVATASCSGCSCNTNYPYGHHSTSSHNTYVNYTETSMDIKDGSITMYTHLTNRLKLAANRVTPAEGYALNFGTGNISNNSRLYSIQKNKAISFYPYIRMTYMITSDVLNASFTYGSGNNTERAAYILSQNKSIIMPNNSVEVSWFNEAQANGEWGLHMQSVQWSVHSKATQGTEWQSVNQVLPGGAIYSLNTENTETWVKTVTYSTLVDPSDITNYIATDSYEYSSSAIISRNNTFFSDVIKNLEDFRLVQWVNKKWDATNTWDNTGDATSVEIAGGGEPLDNLDSRLRGTKASTDAKYTLVNNQIGVSEGATEASVDVKRTNYGTVIYKGFTDVYGNIYVANVTIDGSHESLTQAQLDSAVAFLRDKNSTNSNLNSSTGIPSGMTYNIRKIGSKGDRINTILASCDTDILNLDNKTKFITNLVASVERNTGMDTINATWTTDGRWYNEAFDGIYMVVQTAQFQIGLMQPSKRAAALDPNLCPPKTGTAGQYSEAYKSQFGLSAKSQAAPSGKPDGYIGVFDGMEVCIMNPQQMLLSRPFYIPNANVQDLN